MSKTTTKKRPPTFNKGIALLMGVLLMVVGVWRVYFLQESLQYLYLPATGKTSDRRRFKLWQQLSIPSAASQKLG